MIAHHLRIAGDSDVGKVRTTNEDALIVDPGLGLFAVLDGMGGANAGDVASQLARDTIREFVQHRALALPPLELLEAAIVAGSAAVHSAAQQRPDRHGMGTTVVACLVVDPSYTVVAHVGDSRAYLWRAGRLQPLTRDHTIVEELAQRGLLSPDEALRHPYKNVLSRNLGSKPDARVDAFELELVPGDRLMLCSDGLYGYASSDAIQYLLGSGDAPDQVARDLIELALRGGGGDNVSAIVIEVPAVAASSTQVVRTTGAHAWWKHRQRFLQVAGERGLGRSPVARGLPANDAIDLIALPLCQAIYHDLEKSTGVNVWTFAQNLAAGWFDRGGDWKAVRALVDLLAGCARTVLDEIRAGDPKLGFLLEVAVSRALIVVELALGGLLAERLRQIDTDLIELHSVTMDTLEDTLESEEIPEPAPADPAATSATSSGERFLDRPTIPFVRPDRPITSSGESAELASAIAKIITLARGRVAPRAELVAQVLGALEAVVADAGANFATAVLSARELYAGRTADASGVTPLFDAFDQARLLAATSARQLRAPTTIRVRALRALSTAHQRLVSAATGLVLEAVVPYGDRLREAQAVTAELRDAVASAEHMRADLEHQFATIVDANVPWGARGTRD
jgi:protein phosphatase